LAQLLRHRATDIPNASQTQCYESPCRAHDTFRNHRDTHIAAKIMMVLVLLRYLLAFCSSQLMTPCSPINWYISWVRRYSSDKTRGQNVRCHRSGLLASKKTDFKNTLLAGAVNTVHTTWITSPLHLPHW